MSTAIFMMCCVILVVVPVVFVLSKVYQDGFFGRVGLLGISFYAATFLMEWLGGTAYEMLWQTTLLVLSFTWFLCWHLFRFEMRCLKQNEASVIRFALATWNRVIECLRRRCAS